MGNMILMINQGIQANAWKHVTIMNNDAGVGNTFKNNTNSSDPLQNIHDARNAQHGTN